MQYFFCMLSFAYHCHVELELTLFLQHIQSLEFHLSVQRGMRIRVKGVAHNRDEPSLPYGMSKGCNPQSRQSLSPAWYKYRA